MLKDFDQALHLSEFHDLSMHVFEGFIRSTDGFEILLDAVLPLERVFVGSSGLGGGLFRRFW